MKDSRRQFLRRLSALGLAGALGWEREALAQGARSPGIARIRGTARVNGKPARRGMVIQPGDTVQTGRNSQLVFVMGSDAFMMRSASQVETASKAGGLLADVFRLATGKLLSVFAKGEGRTMETATAIIGIRGTGIYLEAERKRTYACLCYGEALMSPVSRPDAAQTVVTTHHENPLYIYADGAMPSNQMMTKAPVVNHTDAELILLESLVGRTPPFGTNPSPRY